MHQPLTKFHDPGIYFGMTSEEYHADAALGSSDIRALIKSPRKYWLRSWRNADAHRYIDPETKATVLGTALHCYLLEGRNVFVSKYARRPDDVPDASSSDKASLTKAAKKALAPGQQLIHGDEWQLVEDSGRIITAHPDLSEVFTGGAHEVSVFWVDQQTGIPLKARFDILKPRGIGDIKTVANENDLRFEKKCKLHIKSYRYDIQAEHYLEARRQLPKLPSFMSSAVPPKHPNLLTECAKEKRFAFALVFVSKALPEVWGCVLSPGNPMLELARDQIDTALRSYTFMAEQAGPKEWPEIWKLGELDVTDMPGGEWGWD